jgi:Protein of unknown function (DUF4007)
LNAHAIKPRFSGHETFACRFTWLPKAVRLIECNPGALADDDEAILSLGLGKNMVKSLRFWLDAFDVAASVDGAWSLKPFGAAVLGRDGADPFIERLETQWLLHWSVAARTSAPLFAWRHVFHRRMRSDFTRSELVSELRRESAREGYEHSEVTLLQHIDALLHTYLPTHALTAPEDVLDGPLVDLKLIRSDGRRRTAASRAEQVFTLSKTVPGRIAPGVLNYAIDSFWADRRADEKVVSFRDLAYGEGSPGTTLRLGEDDLRDHLEAAGSIYSFRQSGDAGAVSRTAPPDPGARLQEIFV